MARERNLPLQRRRELFLDEVAGDGLLYSVTRRELAPGFLEDRTCDGRPALHCTLRGSGRFNGERLASGAWFHFFPGEHYRLETQSGLALISFGLHRGAASWARQRLGPMARQDGTGSLRRLAEQCWNDLEGGGPWCAEAAVSCLRLIMVGMGRLRAGAASGDDHLLARVHACIRDGDPGSLDVATIARHCGVRPEHLSRRYRARTGATLRDHLRDLRLNRAVDLLAEGLSQREVAIRLGYADAAAFNRSYSRWAGYPPGRRPGR